MMPCSFDDDSRHLKNSFTPVITFKTVRTIVISRNVCQPSLSESQEQAITRVCTKCGVDVGCKDLVSGQNPQCLHTECLEIKRNGCLTLLGILDQIDKLWDELLRLHVAVILTK